MDYDLEIAREKNQQFDDLKVARLWKDTEALYFLEKLGFEKYYDKRVSQLQNKEKKLIDLLEIQLKDIFEENFGVQVKSRGNFRVHQDVGPDLEQP